MYDVIIIGAGAAGMGAGTYAAGNKLKTLVLAKGVLPFKKAAFDLMDYKLLSGSFKEALKDNPKLLELKEKTEVINIEKNVISFSVEIKSGFVYYCRALIIATGRGNSSFNLLTDKDAGDNIKVDGAMATSVRGIFAIGEANNIFNKNLATLIGEGARAVLSTMEYLKN